MVTSVKLGDVDTVKYLVSRGLVNVDTNHRGASLLCLAVGRGDVDMVHVLCHLGADVNTCYTWQGTRETPLIAAVRLGYENIAKILIQTPSIDLNISDSDGKSGRYKNSFISSYSSW